MTFMGESRFPKVFSSKIFLSFLFAIFLILSFSLGREFYRKFKLSRELDSLKSEIDKLENKNKDMSSLIEYFNKEGSLEKEARLRLNLKKPGENVVVILQNDPVLEKSGNSESNHLPAEEQNNLEDSSLFSTGQNLSKWRDYFFGE